MNLWYNEAMVESGMDPAWSGRGGGGGALPALVGRVLIVYLSCVSLSYVCHLPFKIQE